MKTQTSSTKSSAEKKAAYWQSHIDGWRKVGASAPDYCSERNLSYPSFKYWRQKLRQAEKQKPKPVLECAEAQFKEMVVLSPGKGASPLQKEWLCIDLDVAGVKVRLSRGYDHEALVDLMGVLRGYIC